MSLFPDLRASMYPLVRKTLLRAPQTIFDGVILLNNIAVFLPAVCQSLPGFGKRFEGLYPNSRVIASFHVARV